jgi:hypothetical protein
VIGDDYRTIFGPHESRADEPLIRPLEEFLTRHPMSPASKEMVALHEAGHSITFERLGMWMAFAHIHGSAFGPLWVERRRERQEQCRLGSKTGDEGPSSVSR